MHGIEGKGQTFEKALLNQTHVPKHIIISEVGAVGLA